MKVSFRDEIEKNGFSIIPSVLEAPIVSQLISEVAAAVEGRSGHALRHLAQAVPSVEKLAASVNVRSLVEPILGPNFFLVRSLFFDKTAEANWKVAWHQDLTIAVKEKVAVDGFGPWSLKDGVAHVQPPASILERMLTIRVHLDDCDLDNGPLQVLPGSHREGKLSSEQICQSRERATAVICLVQSGGVLVMRPLILHASSAARLPKHRRVVHLEFAAEALPGGLQWLI